MKKGANQKQNPTEDPGELLSEIKNFCQKLRQQTSAKEEYMLLRPPSQKKKAKMKTLNSGLGNRSRYSQQGLLEARTQNQSGIGVTCPPSPD